MILRLRLLWATLLFVLPACSPQLPDCASPQVFCAGLVTTTEGIADHAFNQAAWEEMQIAQGAGLVDEIAYIHSVTSKDYARNIDAFALDDYDLILTTSMGLRDETLQAADLYPDTVFIGIDQADEETRPNLLVVIFPEDQAGFLAGALAARLTKAGHIGAVCETSGIDANWKACEGYRNGAAYIDPTVQVDVKYRNDGSREKLFIDTAWGQDTGRKLVNSGADVIFGVGGGTGQGGLLAAADAQVYAIGSERDQFYALPQTRPVLLTSIVKRPGPRVQDLIRSVRAGDVRGGVYPGQIWMAPYRGQAAAIPLEIRQELEDLWSALQDGSLRTNVPVKFPK
jgi:basic membrane protein A